MVVDVSIRPVINGIEPIVMSWAEWQKKHKTPREEYDFYLQVERESFDRLRPKAEALFLEIVGRLGRVAGDRGAVDAIRRELRENMDFIEVSHVLERMAGTDAHWINACIRAECKRAHRSREEMMEKLRLERVEQLRLEAEIEREALSANPVFGMF